MLTLLAATVAAALWPSPEVDLAIIEPSAARPTAPARAAASAAKNAKPVPALPLHKLERETMVVTEQNPFSPTAWFVAPPPPPQPSAAPPPPPSAPAMPFAYAGRLQGEGGRWTYYLMRGDQSFAVSRGDTFDTSYRLDSVDDAKMVIEYLPLSVKQTLTIMGDS